jgi:hypothetical protein
MLRRKSMCIAGYFLKRRHELRMPKNRDSLGIRFDGSVLTGQKSVEFAQREQEISVQSEPGVLDGILSGKPRSLTPVDGLEPARLNHLRLPGKF